VLLDNEYRHDEASRQSGSWLRQERLGYKEGVRDGIEQAPDAIARLYRDENTGNLLIAV